MAGFELKMPKLGESVTEGTIGKWLKQPGEKVDKYDLLVEVQTDKVNTEIPSPVAGTLKEVKVQEGETVPIGTLLAIFDTADGEAAAQPSAAAPQSTPSPAERVAQPSSAPAASTPTPSASSVPQSQAPQQRASAMPQGTYASAAPAPRAQAVAERPDVSDVRATP